MEDAKVWRQFEALVARIEQAASAHGAVVKSPDRIRDQTTGRLREVDASIRQKVGTAVILVTIECRKRGRAADDTWIEQLATKRQKIGAAKTIAVSATGFTDSAIKTAAQFGIEVRTLSEVNAGELDSWFLQNGAVHVCRIIENIRCGMVLYEDTGELAKSGFWAPDVTLPVCYHADHQSPFPVQDYIPILEVTHPEMFEKVPLDGTKVELEFPIHWGFGELSIATTAGRKWVANTTLFARVFYQVNVCDISAGVHHEYRGDADETIQHSSFNTMFLDLPVTFEHQSDPDRGQVVRRIFRPKQDPK